MWSARYSMYAADILNRSSKPTNSSAVGRFLASGSRHRRMSGARSGKLAAADATWSWRRSMDGTCPVHICTSSTPKEKMSIFDV